MNEIAKARAEKMQDCREWSPLDALEDAINSIKSGEINPEQVVVHFLSKEASDGRRLHNFFAAGVTVPQHIALLNLGLKRVLEEWLD